MTKPEKKAWRISPTAFRTWRQSDHRVTARRHLDNATGESSDGQGDNRAHGGRGAAAAGAGLILFTLITGQFLTTLDTAVRTAAF